MTPPTWTSHPHYIGRDAQLCLDVKARPIGEGSRGVTLGLLTTTADGTHSIALDVQMSPEQARCLSFSLNEGARQAELAGGAA